MEAFKKTEWGYLGHISERDLIGEFRGKLGYEDALRKIASERGGVPYAKMIEVIRRYYLDDPTNPKKTFF
ncbi:hypothetical protein D6827_02380 [Candidatus Parcubacteria bacterium]|nr:MAG: hypothetical protein D6827_02380 [Candidatus Parcubacteria bacterium]